MQCTAKSEECQALNRLFEKENVPLKALSGTLRCGQNLVEFRRRSGERKSDHFLRRHVRRRKYRSACKRARWQPKADSACDAVRPQFSCPKVILLGRETGSAARSLSDCTTLFTCGSTKCPCSRGRSGSTPCSRPACGTLPQTAGTRARRARAPARWPHRCRNP